ncbi:MAG: DUF3788 domain-containing protein [Defluviitaleaceae bacterium]|nr:DUF3788 domain-containing protein [Defluviitaleaceae bacterium]MCL2238405.1 DUF3788 domain-containing protein [Defluviitaleaceae bacterium]
MWTGRMLDKNAVPDEAAIRGHMGRGFERLMKMEAHLTASYDLVRELKFPFGNEYGWGYKFSHKKSHLCYTFFEPDGFTVMLQIPGKQVSAVEEILPSLLPKTKKLWDERYPCGENGGWIHYRVETDEELSDVCKLIHIKKKPTKRT